MQIEYYKNYSYELGRDMEFKSYGWGGKPVLAIPCQNGRFYDWEGFGMLETLDYYLNQGKIRLFTIDTIDSETISNTMGNPYDRIRLHERWYNYVVNEVVQMIHQIMGNEDRILTTGFSMGAYHAANFYFRRPDIFDRMIALSGLYDTSTMYGGYMDEVVYVNDPCASIAGMSPDHPYIQMINNNKGVICVGQGAWEDLTGESTRRLDAVLKSKGINTWVDYWGYDVNHDWPWWKIQICYFLDRLLD